jgi:uncharacterized RDD family membrane protein YckC
MEANDVIGRRIGAAVIDFFIAIILLLLVGALVGNDAGKDASVSEQLGTLDRVLFLVLVFVYFCATEIAWGATVGKRVLGLRVVAANGSAASMNAVLIRNVVRLVDWLPLLYIVGAISVFAGQPRQRLGDRAAKTRVVAADAPPPSAPGPPERPPDEDVIAQIMR